MFVNWTDNISSIKASHQIYSFCLATTFWTLFFLAGLWSDYYQTWTWPTRLFIIDTLPAALMVYAAPALIKNMSKSSYRKSALILAFYFSVPFHTYDFIYLHLYKQEPISYLLNYWYLTFFSVVPWIVFPIIAIRLKNNQS
jgi:hypothetical protein